MSRIILFLILIALLAAGAAWIVEQPGSVALSWHDWHADMSLPVFVFGLAGTLLAVVVGWVLITVLWRSPRRIARNRKERRATRARNAITQGLLAVGHGDTAGARQHANAARRHAPNDPLALLLHAQSAQLEGDQEGARRAFLAMAGRDDTKLLGLRGLFIEAQRADDPYAAVTIAEEALRLAPASAWASHAVLGFRCARSDWTGALGILDNSLSTGLIDKKAYRRQRAVLLTARALELEESDVSLARDSALEAVKLAPTLVPAAVLAAKFYADAHQVRRSLKILETAWAAHPHPDLVEAYAHIKPGETASQRLARVEALVGKNPKDLESGLGIARAAIDAGNFARARAALEPLTERPTRRVAMLMAEIEHGENGDGARSRAWTLRAVRALHDPAWTADGYISDRWRPVSPVTGRLDAFHWQIPLSELPSNKAIVVEDGFKDSRIAPPDAVAEVEEEQVIVVTPAPEVPESKPAASETVIAMPAPAPAAAATPPMFHRRAAGAAPVIPIVRAPDDPGIDEEVAQDDFASDTASGTSANWRGRQPPR